VVTRVVNVQKGEYFDGYVGRTRGLSLGNPYVIGRDGTREEVIEKYKTYFRKRLDSDPKFISAILGLKGKILGCYCKPLPCHGDVIAEYLNNEQG